MAEVVRPAEAEAERTKIAAAAEAQKIRALAEAAAANNRVSLDQQMISQLPDMLQAAASGLTGANLTVLNGNDGLSELISGLAAQGLNLYETLRSSVAKETTSAANNGVGPAPAASGSDGGADGAPASPPAPPRDRPCRASGLSATVALRPSDGTQGPVVQFGVHAGLSSRRSRVQIPSGPRSDSSAGRAHA